MTRFPKPLRSVALLALSGLLLLTISYSEDTNTTRSADRQKLQQLQDTAVSLKNTEAQNPTPENHKKRVQAFAAVANMLVPYMNKYTASDDLGRLLLLYRLSVNYELAEELVNARSVLESCKSHLLYDSSTAVYDGEKVDVLVPQRLTAIDAQIAADAGSRITMRPLAQGAVIVIQSGVSGSTSQTVVDTSHLNGVYRPTPNEMLVHPEGHSLGGGIH